MQTKSYRSLLFVITLAAMISIAVLSFFLYTQGPRVRLVSFEKDPKNSALQRNSTIKITFDRPIENEDYTNEISFEPNIAFTAQTAAQSITLLINENFLHGTEYTLKVADNINDKTGRTMKNSYMHKFSVGSPRYIYIERNYGIDYDESFRESGLDAADYLQLATVGIEKKETLFEAPIIVSFAANNQYAVVVSREETSDSIHTINLNTKKVRTEELRFEARIEGVSISPRGKTAVFIVTPDYSLVEKEYYDQYASQLESLDVETGELTQLIDAENKNIQAVSTEFDTSGQVVLIRNFDQNYLAVSPFNDFEPILIGNRTDSFGFNYDSSEIIFRDNDLVARYIVATGENLYHDFATTDYIQGLNTTSSGAYYYATTFLANQSKSYVNKIESWEDTQPKQVWATQIDAEESLRDVELSYDATILALQISPNNCRSDGVTSNSQCRITRTLLYNHASEEALEEVNGFNIVWLP